MTTTELRALYEASFPGPNPPVAQALGRAMYAPGQRSAQDALGGTGLALNIFDLTPFANGWEFARTDDEFTTWRNAYIPGGE